MEFGHVTLGCPEGNNRPDTQVVHMDGAYPSLRCRVCGIDALGADKDMRRGVWAGVVAWGPNQFEAAISETTIFSYRLYVVNDRLLKLGGKLAEVEVRLWATQFDTSFCDTSYYRFEVETRLLPGAAYFMVVPVTKGGLELNVGPISEPIEDLGNLLSLSAATRVIDSSMVVAMASVIFTSSMSLY